MNTNSTERTATGTPPREVFGADSELDASQATSPCCGTGESADGQDCDHLALLYETREEQLAAVVPFVREGLERGERCVYVHDGSGEAELLAALRDGGVDVDAALASGALVLHGTEEAYLRDGAFDPEATVSFYAEAAEAASEAHEGLRVAAETTWLQGAEPSFEAFMAYEARVDELLDGVDCLALCQYDLTGFPPSVVRDVVRTHPHLVRGGTVCQNFYHVPPAEFFDQVRQAREVDRMLATVREHNEARAALQERERAQRTLYELAAATDVPFEEKVRRLLELGRERFDLDVGFLSRITGDTFEVVDAVGSHEKIRPGATAPLAETYCRQLRDSTEPMGVRHAAVEGWAGDPAHEVFGLESYLGTTVTVDGERYGTLCFASRTPRERPFDGAERTFLELMSQWVSYELERERRDAQLEALDELARDLMTAETRAEIAALTVERARGALRLPLTAVLQYDRESGELEPAATTAGAADQLPTANLGEPGSGPLWEAFAAGEARTVDEVPGADDDVTEVLAVPLGFQGLFVTATTAAGGFAPAERDVVEATGATVEAACTRVDRERELQEREATLEEQNETLGRLNRVNDIIRSIDQALVGASTRGEIETVVCEQLANAGPYELAWVGERDHATDEVKPREWATTRENDPRPVTVTDDGLTCPGPVGEAVRTREPQAANDLLADPPSGSCRRTALDSGYHACIGLPLVYEGTLYGVLAVYADQPGVFDDLERAVLTELSDTIAYAINAVESKKALVSNEVVELEFRVREGLAVIPLAEEVGCTIRLENLVSRTDGGLRGYFTTRGVPAADIQQYVPRIPVERLEPLAEHEDDDQPVCLLETEFSDGSLCETVLDHGGVVRELVIEDGTGRVVVELAADADVRGFVEMFGERYPGAELLAQRTCQRPRRTNAEVEAALTDDLTPRQREVLQTAYASGYFERPRTRTGSEIAGSLGITQPTFNAHLRAAERKLCRLLFEDG